MGAQVVRINADVLHFQSTPSALKSSTGGVESIGIKIAVQASAKNTTKSKELFIAIIPVSVAYRI